MFDEYHNKLSFILVMSDLRNEMLENGLKEPRVPYLSAPVVRGESGLVTYGGSARSDKGRAFGKTGVAGLRLLPSLQARGGVRSWFTG